MVRRRRRVLLGLYRAFHGRGVPAYWSAIGAAAVAAVAAALSIAPFVYVLVVRREGIRATLGRLRGDLTLFFLGETTIVLDLGTLREALVPGFAQVAGFVGSRLAAISAKVVVFAFVSVCWGQSSSSASRGSQSCDSNGDSAIRRGSPVPRTSSGSSAAA